MSTQYEERGVSSSKPEVHAAVARLDKGLFPGAFCRIMPTHDLNRHAIKHADGAGTKAGLAYLAWKHGFPISIWRGITQDSLVMNMDDVACVGATRELFTVTQLINRNPFRIPGEVLTELIEGGVDFCQKMAAFGFDIGFAGGETADVPDLVRTITVDNDIYTEVRNEDVIDASRIRVDDVIIGFSSTGQAMWEDKPNSGIGSNGLTNARHDCLCPDYRTDTETYAPEVPGDKVYCGKYHLEDDLPGDTRFTVGSALLSPTRTYLPLIAELMRISKKGLHALIHCSGGGQTKIGKFGPKDVYYYKHKLLPIPPLFLFLQQARNLPWKEMFPSYNMGHRLEAVTLRDLAPEYIAAAHRLGIDADIIGKVRPRINEARVVIQTEHGTFSYVHV